MIDSPVKEKKTQKKTIIVLIKNASMKLEALKNNNFLIIVIHSFEFINVTNSYNLQQKKYFYFLIV